MTWRDRKVLLRRAAEPIVRDLLGLGGVAMIVFAVDQLVNRAVSVLILGVICVAAAAIWARRGG